ncbi:MAG: hypothetical protein KN64_06800 [Sulfurovum sp. AS07-7]|nr:MAG: hypothetical protein KN64_06800 [Sulfurovum sp. AS07-7]
MIYSEQNLFLILFLSHRSIWRWGFNPAFSNFPVMISSSYLLNIFLAKNSALKFKSPYAILLEKFDLNPELFKENPYLKLRGLNM